MGFITDLLKDVPLSAVIREKLIDAEKKVSVLEQKIQSLELENQNLKISLEEKDKEIDRFNKIIEAANQNKSVEELDETEKQILKFFYEKDKKVTPEEIAQSFSIEIGKVKYHLNNLEKIEYIELSGIVRYDLRKPPDKYVITELGRAYIIENNL
jgi:DNA-binding MarR family transcriptional regulator